MVMQKVDGDDLCRTNANRNQGELQYILDSGFHCYDESRIFYKFINFEIGLHKIMNPRNTVIVITYNQDNLIGRALESVLCQKDLVYEIIVSDDCSSDSTWTVIDSYAKKYPDLIKPIRNEVNLGIFAHIEATWARASGDIIYYLSGDDVFCDGLFNRANKLIKKYNIDFINEAFTLYFDYKLITPTGEESIFRNNLVERYNPVSLKIRQLISNRTTGVSKKVLDKYYPVRKDIGIYADGLIDIQTQLFSDKNYYDRFIGSVYYAGIGISARTLREEHVKSYILSLEQLKCDINNISKEDEDWLNYLQIQLKYSLSPTVKIYKLYAKYFFVIFRKFYGLRFIKREVRHFIIATVRLLYFYGKAVTK